MPRRSRDEVVDHASRPDRGVQPEAATPEERTTLAGIAARLFALAQRFAKRSEAVEARLLEGFQAEAASLAEQYGDHVIRDGDHERLSIGADGSFSAEVALEDGSASWRPLDSALDIVSFYDPTELLADLADMLEPAFPPVLDEGARAVAALHALTLEWRRRSLAAQAKLFAEFNRTATPLAGPLGGFTIVDDEDERLTLDGDGQLRAHVLDGSSGAWRELVGPDELVESYDPTDVFADLADAVAEAFPELADEAVQNESETPQVAGEGAPDLWYTDARPRPWLSGPVDPPNDQPRSAAADLTQPEEAEAALANEATPTFWETPAAAGRSPGVWRVLVVIGVLLIASGLLGVVQELPEEDVEIPALRRAISWVILGIGALFVFVGALAAVVRKPAWCEDAPVWLVEEINRGMPAGVSLEDAYVGKATGLSGPWIVESDEFADAWWIVGKIDGLRDRGVVGAWVTNDLDEANPGEIFAANPAARQYSDWGADEVELVGGEGWNRVRNCL